MRRFIYPLFFLAAFPGATAVMLLLLLVTIASGIEMAVGLAAILIAIYLAARIFLPVPTRAIRYGMSRWRRVVLIAARAFRDREKRRVFEHRIGSQIDTSVRSSTTNRGPWND